MSTDLLRTTCFIDGAFDAPAGATFDVTNPATGAILAAVHDGGELETERAIGAASSAFGPWRALAAERRGVLLQELAAAHRDMREPLAALLTSEQGKPRAEAEAEIDYSTSYLSWFGGQAGRVRGETIPARYADQQIVVTREPIGVCGAITPWNFPSAMLVRKVAAALAAGCTVVAKPSELTPLSALALAALCERIELPPGVFNVVVGRDPVPIASALMASKAVRKVSFTGSTAVGKRLTEQSAATVTKLSLELGGNAPVLVFADADLDAAADDIIASKFRNAGQTCVCINRVLVADAVADELAERLAARCESLVVGDGTAASVNIGPLIDKNAVDKVRRLVRDALDRGATLAAGAVPSGQSQFCGPAMLCDVDRSMSIWHQEIFGPVLTLHGFASEAEAIELANDTDAGLAAYVYSADGARLARVADALEVGMVGLNDVRISQAQAPFGGVKQSGYGREGSHLGIEDYLVIKTRCQKL